MKAKTSIWLFVLLVFIVPIAAYAVFNMYEKKWKKLPVIAQNEIDDFSLVNQDNKIINAAAWINRIVVADFFFTHCSSICPKMTVNLKKISVYFSNDDNVRLASFSVDPERDSTAQLKKYTERFGIDNRKWDFLTGNKKDIYKLARNSFMIITADGDGGPGDFIHSEKLVLIDKHSRIRGYYDGTSGAETDQLLLDIKKLENEN
jgi:protein SCO1